MFLCLYLKNKLKSLIYLIAVLYFVSCDNSSHEVSKISKTNGDSTLADSALVLNYKIDFRNNNIRNNTDKQIDFLFNGVDNYLGGHQHSGINFRTECMPCKPVQKFMGGLLFAKRLLITSDKIKFYKSDFNIPDSLNQIKLFTEGAERKDSKFNFADGKGSIKYIGMSCMDADFNKVHLSYNTGDIIIDSLINASFFEYDLDSNGRKEQYLLGTRNCSQELVILRIKERN